MANTTTDDDRTERLLEALALAHGARATRRAGALHVLLMPGGESERRAAGRELRWTLVPPTRVREIGVHDELSAAVGLRRSQRPRRSWSTILVRAS